MPIAGLYAITSVIIVSLISFVGVFLLSVKEDKLRRSLFILVSLAAGAMFGDAFIHLLPESYTSVEPLKVSLLILAGIFGFFTLEKFLHWHHEHTTAKEHYHPVGYINLIADGIHNFVDGLLIGASYLVSVPVGIATTLAVILHEIPQEIGDFGILLHAGFERRKALLLNFISATFSILGAIIALLVAERSQDFASAMLPLTAGGFIYIAGSDLLPELNKEHNQTKSMLQLIAMLSGVAIMLLLFLFE